MSGKIYNLIESPVSAAATVGQLNDTVASHAWSRFVNEDNVRTGLFLFVLICLGILWFPTWSRRKSAIGGSATATAMLLALLATGCGPAKVLDVVEIKPNETCWVIPLDAQTQNGQAKFNSVGFLEQKKVASKRVMVDKVSRSTGRAWYDYEWIPTVRVIMVDRSLVTREWTDNGAKQGQAAGIKVITKDSIKLTVGLTITASIDEEEASTYLYYHGARPLSDVIDQNIRSFAVAELTRQFSEQTLSAAQTNQTKIYTTLFDDAMKAFKSKGITIQYLGNAEGMHYDDPSIQAGINRSYTAQQEIKTAEQEQLAMNIRNQTKVLAAQTEADTAAKLFSTKDATTFQNTLQIALIRANAQYAMATNWNGKLPNSILPANSPLLMTLGAETASDELVVKPKK